MKNCTDIEQSKKLIELGIDINTADMMWDDWNLIDEGWKLSVGYYPEIEKDYGRKCYPAWSLAALIEVLPEFKIEKTKAEDGYEGYYYFVSYKDLIAVPYNKELIDGFVEMFVKLKNEDLL